MNEVFVNNFSYVLGDETYTVEESVAQEKHFQVLRFYKKLGFSNIIFAHQKLMLMT